MESIQIVMSSLWERHWECFKKLKENKTVLFQTSEWNFALIISNYGSNEWGCSELFWQPVWLLTVYLSSIPMLFTQNRSFLSFDGSVVCSFPKASRQIVCAKSYISDKAWNSWEDEYLHVDISRRVVWFPGNNGCIHYGHTFVCSPFYDKAWAWNFDYIGWYWGTLLFGWWHAGAELFLYCCRAQEVPWAGFWF